MSQRGRALQEIEGENVFPCYTITCLFPSSSYVRGDAWWMPWVVGLGSSAWLAIMLEIEATHIECWFPNNQQLNNRFLRDSMWEFEQAPSKASKAKLHGDVEKSWTIQQQSWTFHYHDSLLLIFQLYSNDIPMNLAMIPLIFPTANHPITPGVLSAFCISVTWAFRHTLCVALSILDMHMTYMNTYN